MAKRILRLILLCTFGSFLFMSSLSAFNTTETYYRDQVAVLMYHHVSDEVSGSATITPKLFRQQIGYLRSKGYQYISLKEFEHFLQGGPVPQNAVLVTFDDGYESFVQKVMPILKRMSIPAVNFIITGTLDDPSTGNIPFMNRQEAETASQSPLVDLQCHTHRLHGKIGDQNSKALLVGRLKTNEKEETDEAYNKRISEDTKACIGTLEGLSPQPVDALAYPYGIFDEKAAAILSEAGIQYAFTVLPKMTTRDTPHMKIPRINAGAPYVTPENLHNSIVRRVAKVKHPYDHVSLRDTVEQIGGEVQGTADGRISVYYNGADCKLKAGSAEAEQNGKSMTLVSPLKVRFGRSYIAVNDLEKLLHVKIYLDPETNTFTTQLPDSSGTDNESGK